ncbi:antibiotic biosynthesis monooxygenase [Rhodoluna sp.]|uniref:putative quinol monooxygenase n=1 Tax=Rhodoluna sp. TaxID=1969481 RepID=UPI0025D77FFB|nr:antibiotic biosynthesis monooxygenase [Rhodoluna sp.]
MTNFDLSAIFTPMPEYLDEIRAYLLSISEEVRNEPGCNFYDLYDEATGKLVFIEQWASREDWLKHNDAPSVAKITQFVEGKLNAPVELLLLTKI